MSLPHVIIAGGSGFLGQALAQALAAQQHRVTILTRTPRPSTGPIAYLPWDGRTPAAWTAALEGARAVVNLTGRSVNCRYTPANRREKPV